MDNNKIINNEIINNDMNSNKNDNRCEFCKKKTLILHNCKCNMKLCMEHRFPDKHKCTFDHKKYDLQKLSQNNPVITAEKIQKIN
jgi:hypothetical protein